MLKLENSVINHPIHGTIKFVPNNTQRLIFSYFLDLPDENVIFLCERQSGTSTAAAALATYMAADKPEQSVAIISPRLQMQKYMNTKVVNMGGQELFCSTAKTITFKNRSNIHLFNSAEGEHQFRGHRFDIVLFDNSVPMPGYIPVKKKIYFITEDSGGERCWFNFAKLPKGDYKFVNL